MKAQDIRELTEEEIQERIDEAVKAAVLEAKIDLEQQKVDISRDESGAKIEKLIAQAVETKITSIFSGVQAGAQIVAMPGVANAADQVLKSAGFEDMDAAPIVDSFASPVDNAAPALPPALPEELPIEGVDQNTSPAFPPRAETPGVALPATPTMEPPIEDGTINEGLEKFGPQI